MMEDNKKVINPDFDNKKYQYKILFSSIIGYAADGFDMLVLSFVMSAIAIYYGVDNSATGFVATITLWGAVIGGYIFGILSDYYGRIRVFAWTILLFSIFTGLTVFASSIEEFAIYRFFAGLGLGGEFGIGMTIVAETWKKEKRAKASSFVAMGWQLGVVAASIISGLVLSEADVNSWKTLFLIGALPALFAIWARYGLKEPFIWLQMKKQQAEIKNKQKAGQALKEDEKELIQFPLKLLFKNAKTIRKTVVLTIMTSVQNFGYYGLMIWLPTALTKQHGLTINKTSIWMIVTVVGMIIGIGAFGYLADKMGRRKSFMTFQILTAIMVIIYASLNSPYSLLIGGAALGFFANGMMGGYGALLSESYSTAARSTAENFIFNTGRAIGAIAPWLIGSMTKNYDFSVGFTFLSGIYVIAAIVVFFGLDETKDVDLK